MRPLFLVPAALSLAALLGACTTGTPQAPAAAAGATPDRSAMTFFVTSVNPGKGGDLGGLAGADAWCKGLADAVGAGRHTWRAYLSAPATAGSPAVNARDRIGKGPWTNADGVVVARNLEELHGAANNINAETGLTQLGARVPMRPQVPNWHDIMTGSDPQGLLKTGVPDATCQGWTSASTGSAFVGHLNRTGINPDPVANVSWNASHGTPGCSLPELARVGGGGLFYCFAAD
ncbi:MULTISPECIES: hypothetical protein [Ramlibacter]|uniref:Lectin n=2 Tax=Ramlibacter aquaticus TaxID=2780094 RepID=A0ABR9SGC1_9BURK|nr:MULTISPECIES: hypothetical protein [Ramlibacter]MBE7941395.1 hypothetical protein [Ramlibacter aquaticus]